MKISCYLCEVGTDVCSKDVHVLVSNEMLKTFALTRSSISSLLHDSRTNKFSYGYVGNEVSTSTFIGLAVFD
ncbi:hypothetical protein ACHAWU_001743 [Discostella pseudostelligera]|uniref:Uncharacterized protein n=1 Tax=Discostella pseudostelligera TaxID=259834 RepID=A0ABD3M8E7_9STRA